MCIKKYYCQNRSWRFLCPAQERVSHQHPPWALPTWCGLLYCFALTLLGRPVYKKYRQLPKLSYSPCIIQPASGNTCSQSFSCCEELVLLPCSMFSWMHSSLSSVWLTVFLCLSWFFFPSSHCIPNLAVLPTTSTSSPMSNSCPWNGVRLLYAPGLR